MPSELSAKRDVADGRREVRDEVVVTKLSPWSMADTVARLSAVVAARGMEVFAVIDHSGKAREVGPDLRDTKLVIFGSPSTATPVIQAAPLAALQAWLAPQLAAPVPLEPIAIDGKAVRGAKTQPLPGGYLLSAFASRRGAVLAQLAIGEREHELTQAVPLLRQVDLSHALVTGDAMFAQRSLCAHIVGHGGHYLFEVA